MAKQKVEKQTAIEKRASKYPLWTLSAKQDSLSQTFTFSTAVAALAFVAKLTVHAELLQHHPAIELYNNKVKVRLRTEDQKGLTAKDFELAKRIDRLRPC